MIKAHGQLFFGTGRTLTALASLASTLSQSPLPELAAPNIERLLDALRRHLPILRSYCERIGLGLSITLIDRIIPQIEADNLKRVADLISELVSRVEDELSVIYFLHLDKDASEYYNKSDLFGVQVTHAFPSAAFDIEEAGKCYALGRSTACVYHLMRALEVPLRLLAKEISIPEDESWNKVLNNFDKMLDTIRQKMQANSANKPTDWKEREQFYSEASGLLRNVKNAWRNNVMHLEKKYTTKEAERILQSTKHFMGFLATRSSE